MPYIFGKLWHLAIIWAIRKAFQCILQGVRILLANHTRISPTSENDSYVLFGGVISKVVVYFCRFGKMDIFCRNLYQKLLPPFFFFNKWPSCSSIFFDWPLLKARTNSSSFENDKCFKRLCYLCLKSKTTYTWRQPTTNSLSQSSPSCVLHYLGQSSVTTTLLKSRAKNISSARSLAEPCTRTKDNDFISKA